MESRYHLIPFEPGRTDAIELLHTLLPANGGSASLLRSAIRNKPWETVVRRLSEHGATALLVQHAVIDQDFIEEHRIAYAQQHRAVDKWCIRVHAFGAPIKPRKRSTTNHRVVLKLIDKASKTPGSYLGFVTLRPLRHAPVGATFLVPPKGVGVSVLDKFDVQLTGAQLSVNATPFLQQESAAGACAQASIWMALRTVTQRTRRQKVSIADLTLAASRQRRFNRRSPGSDGLTVAEMVEALRALGINYFHFDFPRAQQGLGDAVFRVVGPYLDSGLPAVLSLRLDDESGHAVVAVGRDLGEHPLLPPLEDESKNGVRFSEGWTSQLVVHNDNTGPYTALPLRSTGSTSAYSGAQARVVIVPLPSAVLMSAAQAQLLACEMGFEAISNAFTYFDHTGPLNKPQIEVVLRTYLCSRHAWRAWTRQAEHIGDAIKDAYRATSLPELMWVVEMHDASAFNPTDLTEASCCGELLFDAASNAFHGESFVAGRATRDLYPESSTRQELLVLEDDRHLLWLGSTGKRGPGMKKPDYV